jgi:hypothetical protein
MKGQLLNILFIFIALASIGQGISFNWAKSFTGTANNGSNGIIIDSLRNIYTCGYFSGTVDFDPDTSTTFNLTSYPNTWHDIYITKLDSMGNLLWAKSMSGPESDIPLVIQTDATGNVVIAGFFEDSLDFDPGPVDNYSVSVGLWDAFVVKLDSAGEFIWVRTFGSVEVDKINDLQIDENDAIYISGYFQDTIDLSTGPGSLLMTPNGADDYFIMKLDQSGNLVWASQFGGNTWDLIGDIKLDHKGSLFMCGSFRNSVQLLIDGSINTFTAIDLSDNFIAKLDTAGNYKWLKMITGSDRDVMYEMDIDGDGSLICTGWLSGEADFDPGPGVYNLAAFGDVDAYVVKFDSSGLFLWANHFGSLYSDEGDRVQADEDGYIYIQGKFMDTVDFDPGNIIYNCIASQGTSPFLLKLDPLGDLVTVKSFSRDITITDIHIEDHGGLFLSGYFKNDPDFNPSTDTSIMSSPGNFSSFIANFDSSMMTYTSTNIFACNEYPSPSGGTMWTSDGHYAYSSFDSLGNETFHSVLLDIELSSFSLILADACNEYLSPDGNELWTYSGIYYDTLQNAVGCDSIITIDLSIHDLDTSVVNNGITLLAQSGAFAYQWLDCSNGFIPVPGANASGFAPVVSGSYAVLLNHGFCTDTSGCHGLTVLGTAMIHETIYITAYPNPFNEALYIDLNDLPGLSVMTLHDMLGREIFFKKIDEGKVVKLETDGLDRGQYLLKLERINETMVRLVDKKIRM